MSGPLAPHDDNHQLRRPLLAGMLCGLAGMVVDLDHLPTVLGLKLVPPLNFLGLESERYLHSVVFAVGCIGIACAGGLLCAAFLAEWLETRRKRLEKPLAAR